MKITKAYFTLMVKDMPRAAGFWQKAFAMESRSSSDSVTELAWGATILALQAGGTSHFTQTGLGLEVDDLKGACAAVKGAGGQIVMPAVFKQAEGIQIAQVADTEGNRFSLVQSMRR